MRDQLYSRYLTYFLGIQVLIIQILSRYPNSIEKYYSNGLYKYISLFYRKSIGWIPFSIGDIVYFVFIFLFIRFIYIIFRDKFSDLRGYLLSIGATLSVIHFLFYFSWGLNYYRVPLATQLSINSTSYTNSELEAYTDNLITELNLLHLEITHNKKKKVVVPLSKKDIYKLSKSGYENLSKKHAIFMHKGSSVKHSLLSTPLSYMGFAGYLNPFTGEAQVNSKTPAYSFAFTTCHEIAHQLGYAAENEANFIGYLAAVNNENIYFQYAGKISALRYVLSEIYKRKPGSYKNHLTKINKGILSNIQESRDFWNSYENPFEPLFKKSYNTYLKANQQKQGIKSYSYMVNLLLNYHQ